MAVNDRFQEVWRCPCDGRASHLGVLRSFGAEVHAHPVKSRPDADRQFWLIDGKIRGHMRHVIKPKDLQALAEASGRDMVVPPALATR